ncbi:MAG: amidohydrolase family protein [Dehalococcoidales bacterium]|nr:amidohydrolase family protein [Dehalococcoidales bacterium]
MIIDFHAHIFPPQIKKNRSRYIDSDPCFAILYSDPKAKLVTADELIASMDRAGVDISVILNIGWTTHELCLETNDYILESISRYPQRLVGFCSVQLYSPEAALREIERCVQGGIKGIGELRPDMQLFDMGDDQLIDPLVDIMKKHNLIMQIHASEPVGHIYPGKGAVTPEVLYPFIANNPDLTIVCSHWGGGLPFYALMPEVKRAISNVYFDTAASPLLYSPRIYEQAVQLVGTDKILFGSDYPLLQQERCLKEIESCNLPKDSRNLILAGNARRLLGIN